VGEIYYISVLWAAHDINKRGGLMVDGKKKMVQVIKADHQSKPDTTKRIAERMVLQEKVDFLWGTNGSHLMKVINQVADRYKKIALNAAALSDELMDAQNFSRYAFMSSLTTEQIGLAAAYFYASARKRKNSTSFARITCLDTPWPPVSKRGWRLTILKARSWARITTSCF
jgi:branched-chain amino acid transport system substrate-binding protein